MKKILSLTLAVMLVVSAIPTAFAAETQDYSLGTAVTVEGAGGEYTVTVPATLEPGQTGTVTAKGYWASHQILKISAPETIEVTDGTKTTNVNVSFAGIESKGNDLEEMNVPVSISIDDGGIKFGKWTGTIVYDVELETEKIAFTLNGTEYQAEYGMTFGDWVDSEYNTINAKLVDNNDTNHTLLVKTEADKIFMYNGSFINSKTPVTDGLAVTLST